MHWTDEDSRVFAEYAPFLIPEREEQSRIICASLTGLRGSLHVLDLGCGDGYLARAIAQQLPNTVVHGLDGSPHMLESAQARLRELGLRFVPEQFELAEPRWRKRAHPVHAVVSSLVVHHLDAVGKQQLFGDLHDLLEPGGVVTIADVVRPANEAARRIAAAEWDRSVREQIATANGPEAAYRTFVEDAWNMFEHLDEDPVDQPSTLHEQLDWLRAARFTGVDVYWVKAGHAVFGGHR
jgi:tRNA (cmo5U34)-methyltransferase